MHSGIKSCISEQIAGAANENTFTVRHHDIVRMPGNLRKTKGKPGGKVGWAYGRLATVGIWPKNRRIAKQLATVQQLFYSTKSNT